MEYVSRIDALLDAFLTREALAEEDNKCSHCDDGNWAVWRCRDCSIGTAMCRGCMRRTHKENPFHRVEQWNGQFFRPAEQWEVGTYLLVHHHNRKLSCDTIRSQEAFLEVLEKKKDSAEQDQLNFQLPKTFTSENTFTPANDYTQAKKHLDEDIEMSNNNVVADDEGDEEFFKYLQELRDGDDGRDGEDDNNTLVDDDVEDDIEEKDLGEPMLNHYLPDELTPNYPAGAEIGPAQRVIGTYVRVVHTNGIHNIAMINCSCQGNEVLPNDLLAARLLPTSFERIRTLFTAQLLDHFRLSNLELKASAFQFYHLLQRLTSPMDPAAVVDLYREFRRMSRIWRWMKRLKWAGFGNNNKMASQVKPGELSVFCPACPQPSVNIPDDWKEDPARYAIIILNRNGQISQILFRWAYKRIFVADGNFKADHVRQKSASDNVWLSEGGGMVPTREEYHEFLKTAIEWKTVCYSFFFAKTYDSC